MHTDFKTKPNNASIEIVEYNTNWPAQYLIERDILQAALAPWLIGDIEHIGSTSVIGLVAKPVIDIMAPVASLEGSRGAIAAAEAAGYCFYPYKPGEMHWFCKPSPEVRTHHLHLVPLGSRRWIEQTAFRDALRQNPSLAHVYALLKRRLALDFANDREAYTDAKAPFILRVLAGHKT